MAILKDKSKKKKGENIIGKIIYGFLLFAPILSILITSLYVVFNKNAYQSYYGETINESTLIELTSNNDLIMGNTYYYTKTKVEGTEYSGNITASQIEYVSSNDIITDTQINFINNAIRFYFYRGTSTTFYDSENNSMNINPSGLTIKIVYTGTNSNSAWHALYTYEYNKYSYLDNAFDYGMYKTEQNNIYNWAKNTGTYTVLQTTTNQIGITNTFVPMLMAYWLLISVIYFIFDIALILIWAVHDKIHELKDSI